MKKHDSPVLKVSVRMMKLPKKNLTSLDHDRNEVLRIAVYPNSVLNEMWF